MPVPDVDRYKPDDRRAVEAFPADLRVVVLGTGGMSHQLHGERFGHMNEAFDQLWLERIEADPESLTRMTHQEIMQQAGVAVLAQSNSAPQSVLKLLG